MDPPPKIIHLPISSLGSGVEGQNLPRVVYNYRYPPLIGNLY